ncbi:ATPase [Mesorhizobium sp. L-8-10]|uniref:SRPBCC family protein n=1 Tax=unclassified Mesorhizobium TaxID=325217 RepID=UPI001925E134|nr:MULTISPECIES: SRPBCC domain-containing protein [unclassified Mesorhizobium]BCH24589.1 ATPase [Mesorhizobium sp. L-8-3]BCH32325.1 ATPase [Mesorhizobium sp. L-8-10]
MTEERNEVAGDEVSLVTECDLPHPPEKVWRALTVPELLAAWLMPNDIEARPGTRFAFRQDDEGGAPIECEVLEAEPFRRLSYSWRDEEAREKSLTSTVTFELCRAVGGTRLRITHSGMEMPAVRRPVLTLSAANTNLRPRLPRAA